MAKKQIFRLTWLDGNGYYVRIYQDKKKRDARWEALVRMSTNPDVEEEYRCYRIRKLTRSYNTCQDQTKVADLFS